MATQWRRAGLAGMPTGLDYAAMPAVARILGYRPTEELFARLRVLEAEWLSASAEKGR
jgi:hypothetical protein